MVRKKVDFSEALQTWELFEVVRDLSISNPYIKGVAWCRFCGMNGLEHAEDCIWSKANELVVRNNSKLPSPNIDISKVRNHTPPPIPDESRNPNRDIRNG